MELTCTLTSCPSLKQHKNCHLPLSSEPVRLSVYHVTCSGTGTLTTARCVGAEAQSPLPTRTCHRNVLQALQRSTDTSTPVFNGHPCHSSKLATIFLVNRGKLVASVGSSAPSNTCTDEVENLSSQKKPKQDTPQRHCRGGVPCPRNLNTDSNVLTIAGRFFEHILDVVHLFPDTSSNNSFQTVVRARSALFASMTWLCRSQRSLIEDPSSPKPVAPEQSLLDAPITVPKHLSPLSERLTGRSSEGVPHGDVYRNCLCAVTRILHHSRALAGHESTSLSTAAFDVLGFL